MSEGGEARNHETEVEAAINTLERVLRAIRSHAQDNWRGGYMDLADKGLAALDALDAVRCAQGRDTDALALLRAAHGEAVTHELHGKIGRFLAAQARGRNTDAPERSPQAEVEAILRSVYSDEEGTVSSRQHVNDAIRECLQILAARSSQGEDHEAPLVAHAIEEALPFAVEARTAERAAETVLSVLVADRAGEVDRLRAGISFVRGLCTDRASYSVIDERLGELLDGETK